jgi:N-acetylneuraminic acid mutarotase
MLQTVRKTPCLATLVIFQICVASRAEGIHASRLPSLPEPLGVAGAFAGVANDSLLVAGGANFPDAPPWKGGKKTWYDTVYLLSETNSDWKIVGKLPRPLGYGVSITTREGVVCIGGSDAQRHYADCFLLKVNAGKLEVKPLPSLPVPLANAAGALVADTIYLAGGSREPGEQSASAALYALNLTASSKAWTNLAPCPGKARILPLAASLDGDFYLAGGAALEKTNGAVGRVYLRDTWRFRPGAGWKKLSDLPSACVAAPSPAPVLGGQLYVLSADDGSARDFQPIENHPGFPRTILTFDSTKASWSEAGELPAPRVTAPVVFWRGGFVVPSGEMRPGVRSAEVWMFRIVNK